jgi:hypothetical protein
MNKKVKNHIFFAMIIISFFIQCKCSNGQNLYSLNDYYNFVPSASANISLYEFPYIQDSLDNDKNWATFLSFSPSKLGFNQIKQFSGKIISNYFQNSTETFGIQYYGFDLFNEFSANLSYAPKFEKLHLGINLNYNRISVKDFGNSQLFKVDIFGRINFLKNFNLAFFLNNLNRAHFSNYNETIYQNLIISLGLNKFKLDNNGKLRMAADFGTNLDINSHSKFYTSIMVNINDLVKINTKINSKPLIIYSGFSFLISDWMNLTAFIKYQKEFYFEQNYITEFYW